MSLVGDDSNPGTPRSGTPHANTPPPTVGLQYQPAAQAQAALAAAAAAHQAAAQLGRVPSISHLGVGISGGLGVGGLSSRQQAQSKYSQLLSVIEDLGKDIRPTYSGSKTSAERLKRGIVHARILVRECLMETEKSARQN